MLVCCLPFTPEDPLTLVAVSAGTGEGVCVLSQTCSGCCGACCAAVARGSGVSVGFLKAPAGGVVQAQAEPTFSLSFCSASHGPVSPGLPCDVCVCCPLSGWQSSVVEPETCHQTV